MTKSETIAQLYAALSVAQGEFEPPPKDSINPAFKSKYADLPAVIKAVHGPLSKNGLCFTQWPTSAETPGFIALTTEIGHKSGEFIQGTVLWPVTGNTAHAMASAITYARRYGLSTALGIAADDDDDGNEASAPAKVEPIRQAPARRPPAAMPSAADIMNEARTKFELVASTVQRYSPANYESIMKTHKLPVDLQGINWEKDKRPGTLAAAYRALNEEADRLADHSLEPA